MSSPPESNTGGENATLFTGDELQQGASDALQEMDVEADTDDPSMESLDRGNGSDGRSESNDTALDELSTPLHEDSRHEDDQDESRSRILGQADQARQSSRDGSASTPDDLPSVQGSLHSFSMAETPTAHAASMRLSPTPSLRPFDRRFQSRISSSPLASPRSQSPAFLDSNSRRSSTLSQIHQNRTEDLPQEPWEVIRWTKLKQLTGNVFSETGKRNFGKPTCMAVLAFILVGTAKGVILAFDFHQTLKAIIGPGTIAVESGAILSLAISADHTTVAGGHADGSIFVWEITKAAKPFLHLPPLEAGQLKARGVDGHIAGLGVLHLSFLGARRTALVSADGRGMSFSHLASRGLGAVGRTIKTTRILGRYPDDAAAGGRPRKPSAVLAFSALPLGNAERGTDDMGLVAMLTPYLLVIVSTIPIAQTQYKASRSKEITEQAALSGCLAWFPSVKLRKTDQMAQNTLSNAKLVYCWSNVLTLLEVIEAEPLDSSDSARPPDVSFRPRARWKAEEPMVAVQWLSRSVLAVLTITQQLVILEDTTLTVTETVDLINRQILHHDYFSANLRPSLDWKVNEVDAFMHGVVADAFFGSFRIYKGRIFLLGFNEMTVGTPSNWADRLFALMEDGDFIGAIRLGTLYYNGGADIVTVGLPDNDSLRQETVGGKLLELLSASLNYVFGPHRDSNVRKLNTAQLQEFANASLCACISMNAFDFFFDDVYISFEQSSLETIVLEVLEPFILNGEIRSVPPSLLKSLVRRYTAEGLDSRLEEMICRLETTNMDIDQVTTLCKQNNLYDALISVWNRALKDYITPLVELMSFLVSTVDSALDDDGKDRVHSLYAVNALKIFPYLSYTLTSRVYPTGEIMTEEDAVQAKTDLYSFLFAGRTIKWPKIEGKPILTQGNDKGEPSFPYLRLLLGFDAASFISVLNEAFEDSFLNGQPEGPTEGNENPPTRQNINRQYIISILLQVMDSDEFGPEQTIYLDMFIARNMPKFPQFILLSGSSIHRVLVGLCDYPSEDIAEDCQLSVEYLLSTYHPAELDALIPRFEQARFYRVLKSIYRADGQYGKLLKTYFNDWQDRDGVFDCIGDCLRPGSGLSERQLREVQSVIERHAGQLVEIDTAKTAETVDRYAPGMHEVFLQAMKDNLYGQFIYLRTILEGLSKGTAEDGQTYESPKRAFVEQYVRLLCTYDPSHVMDFINHVQTGSLRLDEVLPSLEDGGVVDAAVMLMAREGQVRNAMNRLLKHLATLAATLHELQSTATPMDLEHRHQAVLDSLEALQKYTNVGIWICQRQTKAVPTPIGSGKQSSRDTLSPSELLWLDLVDTVVRIVKEISIMAQPADEQVPTAATQDTHPDDSTIRTTLRSLVQDTFTALLTVTTSVRGPTSSKPTDPPTNTKTTTTTTTTTTTAPNISFLRILRAFLTRATLASPSLSDLRTVLTSIFSAYAYEESLLALSNKLLEKDLFVQVAELTRRRRRGWRPARQSCEGCGRRTWGPGTGGGVWEAWRVREREREGRRGRGRSVELGRGDDVGCGGGERGMGKGTSKSKGKGKEKERVSLDESSGGAAGPEGSRDANHQATGLGEASDSKEGGQDDGLGPLFVFSCQHVFHKSCLRQLLAPGRGGDGQEEEDSGDGSGMGTELFAYRCVVCTS